MVTLNFNKTKTMEFGETRGRKKKSKKNLYVEGSTNSKSGKLELSWLYTKCGQIVTLNT